MIYGSAELDPNAPWSCKSMLRQLKLHPTVLKNSSLKDFKMIIPPSSHHLSLVKFETREMLKSVWSIMINEQMNETWKLENSKSWHDIRNECWQSKRCNCHSTDLNRSLPNSQQYFTEQIGKAKGAIAFVCILISQPYYAPLCQRFERSNIRERFEQNETCGKRVQVCLGINARITLSRILLKPSSFYHLQSAQYTRDPVEPFFTKSTPPLHLWNGYAP